MTWSRKKRPATARFWDHVDVVVGDGCWAWTAARDRAGYGSFGVTPKLMVRAHRWSYEMAHGPIPAGMFVMHTCDNPPCVRPDHLTLGTALDNNRDAMRKERNARGDRHGRRHIDAATAAVIRSERAAGAMQKDIAAAHGISETTVSRIVRGLIWKGDTL